MILCKQQAQTTMPTNIENVQISSRSNPSQRIIAIGIVFAFLYFVSSVVIAVFLAALIAYFLDPIVKALERMYIPRALGALIVLLVAVAILSAAGYLLVDRAEMFAEAWPTYSAQLRRMVNTVDRKLTDVERQVSEIAPNDDASKQAVRVEDSQSVRAVFLRAMSSLGSLYSVLLVWTFLPFLIFFMLAAKQKIWRATLDLFPEGERSSAREALDEVSVMLRSYVAGTMLVVLILIATSWGFFWLIGLPYPFLTALISGMFNIIPYLGAVLAWGPPFLIGLGQWRTVGPFLGVAGGLSVLHLTAANVLMPAIVGRRVHLNALAVTVALLFWGWLWGGMGLLLAIPITAVVKVICDHVPSWQPVGRWLGA
jgi:predicted PurR-regulated permease PerM